MSIEVKCSQRHSIAIDDDTRATTVECPICHEVVQVSSYAAAQDSENERKRFPNENIPSASDMLTKSRRSVPKLAVATLIGIFFAGSIGLFRVMRPKTSQRTNVVAEVEDVVKQHLDILKKNRQALSREEERKLIESFTKNARPNVTGIRIPNLAAQIGTSPRVQRTTIQNEQARVTVTSTQGGKEDSMDYLLRREEMQWRIYGFERSPALVGNNTTSPTIGKQQINFEKLDGIWEGVFGAPPQEIAKQLQETMFGNRDYSEKLSAQRAGEIASLSAMDRSTFEKSWEKDLSADRSNVTEVLQELAVSIGGKLDLDSIPTDVANKRISLVTRGSPWELFDRVCEEIEMYPNFHNTAILGESPVVVTLKSLPRTNSVAYAGPTLILLEKVEEFAPHTTGRLVFRMQNEALTPGLRLFSNASRIQSLSRVVDNDGNNLLDGMNCELRGLFRKVSSIASCEGSVKVSYPSKVDRGKFTELRSGVEMMVGNVNVRFDRLRKGTQSFGDEKEQESFHYEFSWTTNNNHVLLVGFDVDGKPIVASEYLDSNQIRSTQAIESVQVLVVETSDIEFPFVFTEIPLSMHALQSETLEPLQFDGSVPLQVLFKGVHAEKSSMFHKAKFELSNRSNKSIRQAHLELTLVQSNRKMTFQHNCLPKVNRKANEISEVVKAQGTISIDVPLPGARENATVDPRVRSIQFVDGTEWKASQ